MKTIVYRRLMLLVPVAVLILLLSITSALPVHAQGCQQGGPEGGGPGGFGGMGPGGGGGMGPGGGNFPPPGLTGGGGMYPPSRRGGGLGMGPPPGPPGGGGMGGGMGNGMGGGMGNGMGPGFGQGGYGSAGMFPHFGPGGGGPGMSDEDEGGPGMTAPGDGGPGMFPHFGPGGGGPGMSALDRTGRGMGSGSAGGMCPAHMGGGRGVFPPSPPPMATGGQMGLRMDNVALTESQQERFANLRADTMEKAAPVIVRVQSIERQYRTALMQPSVNREQLARLQSQLAAQKQTLDAIYGNSMAVSAQLLTREQRQTMRQRMVREQDRSGANRPAAASAPAASQHQ